MRINIVEKGPHTFYGILNAANITDNFVDYWDDFYRHVPLDYSAPIGFSTVPDGMGNFKYYTCIQKTPTDNELFEEVTLPKTTYAIFELKGSVKKTIPIAWKFARENFEISDSPSIEVYSVGNRLSKKYRMELWIPISDVLTNFQKNNGLWGRIKRGFGSAVDSVVEFSKSDTGQTVITISGLVLAAGLTLLISDSIESENNFSDNDENFDTEEYTVDAVEEYNSREEFLSHNYPDERKSPIVHIAHRGDTHYLRGGTDEEKQRFREENNVDF
ncbi:GyrI-like domain-containing protein [Streptococcus iniae]|uniref:GyrI-like domain-containing protein n=1 Tax=Streptococcus iniae TaxID=1346 RepID=UPI000EFCBE6C|nr:GyrI-like domain-containing protein [Streptococcus iniae]RMI73763.1 AraC family transcriptional regulator [Streptococcus iniae]